MRKILIKLIFVGISFFWSSPVSATTFLLSNAHINGIESYGSQFTFYFDVNYPANACRNFSNGAVALNSSTEPGKSQMAALLTAMVSAKKVNMHVRDDLCSGDRPTIDHFYIIN